MAELAPHFGQIIIKKGKKIISKYLLHPIEMKFDRNQIDWLQCKNNFQYHSDQCCIMIKENKYL